MCRRELELTCGNYSGIAKWMGPNGRVINIGDMLQECSQGYFCATKHRVINPEDGGSRKSRYSMPLFLHPKDEVRLSEKYTAKQYLEERLQELGLL